MSNKIIKAIQEVHEQFKGGSGSGNFGHSGRPGKRGGSAGGGKGGSVAFPEQLAGEGKASMSYKPNPMVSGEGDVQEITISGTPGVFKVRQGKSYTNTSGRRNWNDTHYDVAFTDRRGKPANITIRSSESGYGSIQWSNSASSGIFNTMKAAIDDAYWRT